MVIISLTNHQRYEEGLLKKILAKSWIREVMGHIGLTKIKRLLYEGPGEIRCREEDMDETTEISSRG